MRSEKEVRDKLDALMSILNEKKVKSEDVESLCCQIDGLLWVLEDRSGAKLFDERNDD